MEKLFNEMKTICFIRSKGCILLRRRKQFTSCLIGLLCTSSSSVLWKLDSLGCISYFTHQRIEPIESICKIWKRNHIAATLSSIILRYQFLLLLFGDTHHLHVSFHFSFLSSTASIYKLFRNLLVMYLLNVWVEKIANNSVGNVSLWRVINLRATGGEFDFSYTYQRCTRIIGIVHLT